MGRFPPQSEGKINSAVSAQQASPQTEATRENGVLLLQAHERADADVDRATRVVILAEIVSSTFGLGLALVLVRLLGRLGAQERKVEHTVRRLHAVNADLDAFAGRVAHDLRNALAPMRLASGLLQRRGPEPTEIAKVAAILDRSGARMAEMIDALLMFSRAQSAPAGSKADVCAVVSGVLDECASLARQLDVRVRWQVEPALVEGPSGLVHVVALNLVNNAVKFLEGEPTREVTVTGTRDRGRYLLEVRDSGPGLSEEDRARVYEPFYRAPGVKAPGLGIGLATVKRAVEALGGEISVESGPGRGAVFRVRLRLASPEGGLPTWLAGRPEPLPA